MKASPGRPTSLRTCDHGPSGRSCSPCPPDLRQPPAARVTLGIPPEGHFPAEYPPPCLLFRSASGPRYHTKRRRIALGGASSLGEAGIARFVMIMKRRISAPPRSPGLPGTAPGQLGAPPSRPARHWAPPRSTPSRPASPGRSRSGAGKRASGCASRPPSPVVSQNSSERFIAWLERVSGQRVLGTGLGSGVQRHGPDRRRLHSRLRYQPSFRDEDYVRPRRVSSGL